jgi:hypothetical protein
MRAAARVQLEVPRQQGGHPVVVREVTGEEPAALGAVGAVPSAQRFTTDRRGI